MKERRARVECGAEGSADYFGDRRGGFANLDRLWEREKPTRYMSECGVSQAAAALALNLYNARGLRPRTRGFALPK